MLMTRQEIKERIKQLEDSLEFLNQSNACGIGPIAEKYREEIHELKTLLLLRENKETH